MAHITLQKSSARLKRALSIFLLSFFLLNISCYAQSASTDLDAKSKEYALSLLKNMCDHLAAIDQFSYQLAITDEFIYEDGTQVQMEKYSEVVFNREKGWWVTLETESKHKRFWYDGKNISLLTLPENYYSIAELSGENDHVLDLIYTKYNVTLPLSELLYTNPYEILSENVNDGFYAGLHNVDNQLCHHLVFIQDDMNWQLWISDSPDALPVKLIITYKSEFGQPNQTIRIKNWKTLPAEAVQSFNFIAPMDASKIEFLTND